MMLGELKAFEPKIAAAAAAAVALAKEDLEFIVLDRDAFARAPRISIDYAVMERTSRAAVLEADVGWSDVGEWSAVWRLSAQDANGNSLRGRAIAVDSSNVLVCSDEHLAAVIGLDNIIVVATGDAILVVDKAQTHKVKRLVEQLKAENHPEATQHRRMYRPSGITRASTKVRATRSNGLWCGQAAGCRCRSTIIAPSTGSWCAGPRGDVERVRELVHENESIYLPIGSDHRLTDPGKIDLD